MENSKPIVEDSSDVLIEEITCSQISKAKQNTSHPSPVEVREPPITPQLLRRQRWSNFVNHKVVARGIADESQEEAESEIDKNCNILLLKLKVVS